MSVQTFKIAVVHNSVEIMQFHADFSPRRSQDTNMKFSPYLPRLTSVQNMKSVNYCQHGHLWVAMRAKMDDRDA